MAQRTRDDEIMTDRTAFVESPRARAARPKKGDGVCQHCERFDVEGLTRALASGYLLCHRCISSSRVRAECARIAGGQPR